MKRSLLLFAIAWMATQALAEEGPRVEPKAIYALCAAANAILSSQGDGGLLDEIIQSEARRHATAARQMGASQEDIEQVVRAMGRQYNVGAISWDEIADLAYQCTELKTP